MSDATALMLAAAFLALNAFFVGAEFALISARRSQIEPRAAEGSRAAKTTLRAMENVSQLMACAQLGITVCSLGLGAIAEPAVAHLLEPPFEAAAIPEGFVHPASFAIALALIVYLHVVVGEMVPKNLALAGPERSALLLAPPMVALVMLLRPLVVTLNVTANLVLRLLRVQPRDEVASAFTREEVAAMVDESRSEGLLRDDEYSRLAGAIGFAERSVERVLLPISTLTTVRRHALALEVESVCAQTGFSRFPVSAADDDLIGYVHIKDLLETGPDRPGREVADKWIRPLVTVRPGALLHEALAAMRREGSHMGRVVTDEGTILGVVTLEDVLEELVGEVRDASHASD